MVDYGPYFRCLGLTVVFLSANMATSAAMAADTSEPDQATTMPAAIPIEMQFIFPGALSQGHISSRVHPSRGCELVTLRASDGSKIAALFGKSTIPGQGNTRPTLLYFYGNGMCMADSLTEFNRFRGLGFNALMVDYEGYGMSDGSPSEAGCYAAADAGYEYLSQRNGLDPRRIVSTGWSLGAAVAIELATRKPVAGIATFSAFTNISDMAGIVCPEQPAATFSNIHFDSLANIGTVSCPLFMAHGTTDQLVPPEMLDRLTHAAKTKVTVIHVKGAGHNDIFRNGGDSLYKELQTFVDALPPATPRSRT
jgi:fermentation-respiration switch protein FrsA (DUF1100 family)